MVSTKGRYALRVMLDLAEHNSGAFIPLSEISRRQGISMKYLEIILKTLVRENLLEGRRGKGGGYRLTRPPGEYSVGEILDLTEGTMASVACLSDAAKECPREKECKTISMWKKYDAMVHDFFRNISIADLLEDKI
ncbi:MAG: Rrf2 family transcriptional regulator [Lachnospiraceae bacterium]|nr:Rrf2 family transcriptional regulator [Lachnospiraceae bacterium]